MTNITRELRNVINTSAFRMNDPIKEMADFLGTEYRLDRSTFENQRNMLRDLIGYIEVKVGEQDFEDKRAEIYEDAKKSLSEYWCCEKNSCANCHIFDGVNPMEHYDSVSCTKAMMIDLLNRLENLFREKYDAEA